MLATLLAPATLWGLAAAVPAVALEYLFRRLDGPWHSYWYIFIPAACFINYAFSTTISRICLSAFVLGDQVGPGSWFAVALLLMARIVQVGWK
jgi:hypothetical protein